MRSTSLFLFLMALLALCGCSNFFEPVESTGAPTEYEFNYWLLQHTYLFEEELTKLDPNGDSTQLLYDALDDRYTRYAPPSKSTSTSISINTSLKEGDVGMEYKLALGNAHPLITYRVYPNGPAGKAHIPRYANIVSINGIELTGEEAYNTYRSVLDTCSEVELVIYKNEIQKTYKLTKETVYAPTIFLDTLYGTTFITISEFKLNTADLENGTLGELKSYLDSTQNETKPRVINVLNNPGGHVSQCVGAADQFVSEGMLSAYSWRTFTPDGGYANPSQAIYAVKGDAGEKGKFAILANGGSASCAEIFTAAVSQLSDTPIIGSTTYGKGIGQTNYKTVDNGLAIITNLLFKTPNGTVYHKKGLKPNYPCDSEDFYKCAINALQTHFGSGALSKKGKPAYDESQLVNIEEPKGLGGAIVQQEDLAISK